MRKRLGRFPSILFKAMGALVIPILLMVSYICLTRGTARIWYTTDEADDVVLALSMMIGACFAVTWVARWRDRLLILAVYLPVYYGLLLLGCLWYTLWYTGTYW